MKSEELYKEFNLLLLKKIAYTKELFTLKDGYISTKIVSGKKYSYLQKKTDGRVQSEYIKEENLPLIKSHLKRRGEIVKEVELLDEQLNQLEGAAVILDEGIYHKFIILRRCALMDSMPIEVRKMSLEFGDAMTALEGIPASVETLQHLSLWAADQCSFRDSYLQTLAKYNLIEA